MACCNDWVLIAPNYELSEFQALQQLHAEEIDILLGFVSRRTRTDRETLFEQADPAGSLYFIASGKVRIDYHQPGRKHASRIATINLGMLLGELAMIDQKPGSASARADGKVSDFELNREKFDRWFQQNPETTARLMTGIAGEIAARVRLSNLGNEAAKRLAIHTGKLPAVSTQSEAQNS